MRKLSVLAVTEQAAPSDNALLAALRRSGVRLRVLGAAGPERAEWLDKAEVPFEPLALLGKRDLSGIEVIRWHLDEFRPDIVQLIGARAITNGLAAARHSPARIAVHRGSARRLGLLDPLNRICVLNARVARVLCAAEVVRRALLAAGMGPFKPAPEKFATVYAGYDLAWYRAQPLDLALIGVPRGAFVAACVTDVRHPEGLTALVSAAQHLPAGLPIHFLLLGAAVTVPPVMRLIRRSPYRDRFHALGAREDASQIIAASDMSVLLGPRGGGIAPAAVESMAYQVTPVVSDAGATHELIEHERSGLVVAARDEEALSAAILRLYVDRNLCRELGRAARQRIATRFTVDDAAARTLLIYQDLLDSSRPSAA